MSTLHAIVPARILRRWDDIAAAQLCDAASRLVEENERLAMDAADAWQMLDNERDINRELAELCDAKLGITKDGQMLVLPAASSS